jgi:hypothetical protein
MDGECAAKKKDCVFMKKKQIEIEWIELDETLTVFILPPQNERSETKEGIAADNVIS